MMQKYVKENSSPLYKFHRQQPASPRTPELKKSIPSPSSLNSNNSAGRKKNNERVLFDPPFNFPSLPYHIQKRFAELVDTQIAVNFLQTNKTAASFTNFRTIVRDLKISYYFDDKISYRPKIDDVKTIEVSRKLILEHVGNMNEKQVITTLPIYYAELNIAESGIKFNVLKALIEHKYLKDVRFDGTIDFQETEIPLKVLNTFFDRLTKIRKIRLAWSFLSGNEKNQSQFMATLKKYEENIRFVHAFNYVIFTRKIHRRGIYDI